jgi:putative transposase
LKIVGVLEATYYHRKKIEGQAPKNHSPRSGRPITIYSWTKDRQRVSDEQIKEWLMELAAGEESAYGYRKFVRVGLKQIVFFGGQPVMPVAFGSRAGR